MKSIFNFLKKINKQLELNESYQLEDSSSYRSSIPLKIYPYALKYHGKILTRSELEISNQKLGYLLENNYLKSLPSIKSTGNSYQCLRCESTKLKLFAEIECKKCLSKHKYCRCCLEMNRVLECESLYYWHDKSIVFKNNKATNHWQGKLTKSQLKGANKSIDALERHIDILIWAVTGSGKTELVFPVITQALEKGMRVCIASPRVDVVKEFRLRIDSVFKNVSIAALYAGSEEHDQNAQLIIATNHQLLRFRRTFDLLIIDEVDAFPYSSDDRLKKITQRSRKKVGSTIYLTATPNRALKKLPTVFIPRRYHDKPLIMPQLRYSYHLKKYLAEKRLPLEFIQILKVRKRPARQLLVFVPTVKLTNALKIEVTKLLLEKKLIKNKKEVEAVHASDNDRSKKVNDFREQKLYCLITTTILERGVTFPSIDVVVIHADNPVFNSAALVQISGRAGRNPEDPKGHVYFIVNNNTQAIKKCLTDLKYMNYLAKKTSL